MNDFTKEELDELRSSRCYHLDDNYPYEDALFMKLQSMIDNYCNKDKQKMTFDLVYSPPEVTFDNFHEVLSKATGIYECVRCRSTDIDTVFKIKYGLHYWFLCKNCSSKFMYLVRNTDALNHVPQGYGHWTVEFNKPDITNE